MPTTSKEELLRYWLLTSAIDHAVSLCCFFPKFEWGPLNMRDIPGCIAADYARELLVLFDRELIEFNSKTTESDVKTRSGILQMLDRYLEFTDKNPDARLYRRNSRTLPDTQYVFRPDLKVNFALTEKGGEAWEEIAQPNWFRFFGQSSSDEDGELISQDLTLLLARLGWFNELAAARIDINTIELLTHSEFQVLYWKKLPQVYRATFSLENAEPRWPNERLGEPKWFRDWWHSASKWFTQPWDLPDWPVDEKHTQRSKRETIAL